MREARRERRGTVGASVTSGPVRTAAAVAGGVVRLAAIVLRPVRFSASWRRLGSLWLHRFAEGALARGDLLQHRVGRTAEPGDRGFTPALRVSSRTSETWSSVISVTTVPSAPARAVRPERCR